MDKPKLSEILTGNHKVALLHWAVANDLDCVLVRVYSSSIRFEEYGDRDDACIEFKFKAEGIDEYDGTGHSIAELVFGTKSWEKA